MSPVRILVIIKIIKLYGRVIHISHLMWRKMSVNFTRHIPLPSIPWIISSRLTSWIITIHYIISTKCHPEVPRLQALTMTLVFLNMALSILVLVTLAYCRCNSPIMLQGWCTLTSTPVTLHLLRPLTHSPALTYTVDNSLCFCGLGLRGSCAVNETDAKNLYTLRKRVLFAVLWHSETTKVLHLFLD